MGMPTPHQTPGSKILALTVDSQGKVAFDAVVKQNENASKIVYSQHKDLVPKVFGLENDIEKDADEEEKNEIEETMQRTKEALEKIVNVRLSAAHVPTQSNESKFIKYRPFQQQSAAAFNSGAKERIIRMVEMPVDPLEPPKFKHKRVPKPSGSPPMPLMHSPLRPVTVKDQQDWKIPPCISNWKNPKGYTIPLDKRLAAMFVADKTARVAVKMRSKVRYELMLKENERKDQELRALAQKALSERTGIAPAPAAPLSATLGDAEIGEPQEQQRETREEREERLQRDKIREDWRRERERERRLESRDAVMGKKSKITRDRDRDISEKVALGMANVSAGRTNEVMYDQRLFNQDKGIDSGFATDGQYNLYDKGLFNAQPTLSTLYRPKKDSDADMYGGADDEQLDKILKTERFKPDKAFSGASERLSGSKRERPVEFDRQEENDPFDLDRVFDKICGGRTMKASAGSSMSGGGSGNCFWQGKETWKSWE